jgi:hypothetical protein
MLFSVRCTKCIGEGRFPLPVCPCISNFPKNIQRISIKFCIDGLFYNLWDQLRFYSYGSRITSISHETKVEVT